MTAVGYDHEDEGCTGACCDDAPARSVSYVTALERIQLVAAWYTARIGQARATGPDAPVPAWLSMGRDQCLQDQRSLSRSSQARLNQLAEEYAVRYHQLTATFQKGTP